MNTDNIKLLLKLLDEHQLEEIDYSSDGESIRLVKQKRQDLQLQSHEVLLQEKQPQPTPGSSPSTESVRSPIVGTYYSSASADKPPFVKVGDTVQSGQTLCIIEAMKILNPVTSPRAGVIKRVAMNNEEPVEYNQILFDIEAV